MRKLTTIILAIFTGIYADAQRLTVPAQTDDAVPGRVRYIPSPWSAPKWEIRLPEPVEIVTDTLKMVFIGDFMMHREQLGKDCRPFLKHLRPILEEADIAVANMEFTLAGAPYTGYPCFSAPDSIAEYAADCGIDIFLAANNHILDKGNAGLKRTIRVYEEMEQDGLVRYTGVSADSSDSLRNPLILRHNGAGIALVNFTYGTNAGNTAEAPKVNLMDKGTVGKMIARAANRGAGMVIALPHWGNEYVLKHSKEQEKWAEWLVSQGVDAIVGSHPHVVQDSTSIKGAPVFYSLGNAISNMSAENTQLELAVELSVATRSDGHAWLCGSRVHYLWCSRPGGFSAKDYVVLPIAEFRGKRSPWHSPADYDRMMSTLQRVRSVTKVQDPELP